jgi:DNA-binding XRE family transcriptional regulator
MTEMGLQPHASFVARAEGVSFSKVWRLAERECIELTAGRAAKGYKRLSPERRAKVIEVRRANPNATQEEIARIAGVSRSTVWRIERGRRGALVPLVG